MSSANTEAEIMNKETQLSMELESENNEIDLKNFMKEISKSLNEGNNYQATIPNLRRSKKSSKKIDLTNLNYHLKEPERNIPSFDLTRQRIRSVGFASTGLSVLTPKRDLNRYLVWDPKKVSEEFLVKCSYLNQFLIEKKRPSLTFAGMKKYFEVCKQDEAIFIDSIIKEDKKFKEFVEAL